MRIVSDDQIRRKIVYCCLITTAVINENAFVVDLEAYNISCEMKCLCLCNKFSIKRKGNLGKFQEYLNKIFHKR